MALQFVVESTPDHRVEVSSIEGRYAGQGFAQCSCGWTSKDVLLGNTSDAALRHAQLHKAEVGPATP